MGKETTMMAVTVAGLISASSIAGMQKYLNVHYDKNGEKLASPGFSLTSKFNVLSPASKAKTF